VEGQARAVIDGAGAKVMAELTAERVGAFLAALPPRGDPPKQPSARTRETYRQAGRYFTAWLAKPSVKRVPIDPLASLERITGVAVRSRRALDEKGLQRLLDAARARPLANFSHVTKGKTRREEAAKIGDDHREHLELCGLQRALVYKFAALTLARFGAIRRLTVDALRLDDPTPHAVFSAANVKKGKETKKPLPPELVEDLREWLKATNRRPATACSI
jgi:integrase